MARRMRIVSYNIFGFRMLKIFSIQDFAEAIGSLNPDVIFLQEVDEGRLHRHNELSIQVLSDLLGMKHIYHPTYKSRVSDEMLYGNALISPFSMTRIREDHLPGAKRLSFTEPRGVLLTELDFHGRRIHLFNTHLSFWPHEKNMQMRALASEWASDSDLQDAPVILAGDFNMGPHARPFRHLRGVLNSASENMFLPTWPSQRAWRQLDYVFVNTKVQVLNCFTPNEKVFKRISDHLPVVVDISI